MKNYTNMQEWNSQNGGRQAIIVSSNDFEEEGSIRDYWKVWIKVYEGNKVWYPRRMVSRLNINPPCSNNYKHQVDSLWLLQPDIWLSVSDGANQGQSVQTSSWCLPGGVTSWLCCRWHLLLLQQTLVDKYLLHWENVKFGTFPEKEKLKLAIKVSQDESICQFQSIQTITRSGIL